MKLLILLAAVFVTTSAFKIESRMSNAKDADIIPYQVGISMSRASANPYAWCGGSVISNEWILTAAHCIRNRDFVDVYLGSTVRLEAEVEYTVNKEDFIIHPDYDSTRIRNDIALIKIPWTEYTDKIRNVVLPAIATSYPSYVGEKVIASGWGLESDEANSVADNLHMETFDVISNEECNKSFAMHGIADVQICIATSNRISPCVGDSGGPLVLTSSDIQIGINSFVSGGGCTINWPAGFTRVTSFLDWIKDNTGVYYGEDDSL